jgi:tetratricopeptide (TPR) repeat protein
MMNERGDVPGAAMRRLSYGLLLAFSLLAPSGAFADQNDERLDELFTRLKNTADMTEGTLIAAQIWEIWIAHDNPEYFNLMVSGIRHMNSNALSLALQDFNRLVALAPDYAEAWNKRATIHYLLQDYQASTADIEQTLRLEPFHFGALSGLGLVNLAQGNYEAARNAFRTILEFYPAMPGIRTNVEEIDNYLRNSTI